MSSYAVWLDHENAKIFKFTPGAKDSVEAQILHRKEIRHHTNRAENEKKANEEKFYHDVAAHLGDAKELLILGPGTGKSHFHSHLESHHHHNLAKAVVGVEAMDHPTDKQIVASARKFFKKWDMYHE